MTHYPLLLHGDALELLPTLLAGTVDVVICDPPAGIGFMGKPWDSFATYEPRTHAAKTRLDTLALLGLRPWESGFVAFMVDIWTEVDRVLKPGGFVCAWALPKTADLAGLAMRLAGWTIHESVLHLFGCLADETELLTELGWVNGRSVARARLALCYDVDHGTYQWRPIERHIRFPYQGPAFRVHGEHTDHVVTPDHRCVDARPGAPRFVTAEEAHGSQASIHVPTPDDLPELRGGLDGHDLRPGDEGQDVRPGVRSVDGLEGEDGAKDGAEELRDLRVELLAQEPGQDPAVLLGPLLRHMAKHGPGDPRTDGRDLADGPSGCDARGPQASRREDDGGEQPRMERGRVRGERAREAEAPADHALPRRPRVDGLDERVDTGTPRNRGACLGAPAGDGGDGAPHRRRRDEQRPGEPDAVQVERGPSEVRGRAGHRATMGRVDRVDFDGHMWCVTVPTGAFVARTAAGPFVTGNSGMNKAGCIGKQIDKMHGAEREVVGVNPSSRPNSKKKGGTCFDGLSESEVSAGVQSLTAPATDDAKRWTGWHSQVAPGHEQWLIARKPSKLTYARQLLEHGCGAFNVGATRVPRGDGVPAFDHVGDACQGTSYGARAPGSKRTGATSMAGSHPRNVILTPGGEGCPVEGLDRQSGVQRDGVAVRRNRDPNAPANGARLVFGEISLGSMPDMCHGGSGGASRYFTRFDQVVKYCGKASDRSIPGRSDLRNEHPTHKHPELMRWLVRLMAATSEHTGDAPAVVLDWCMGSGTTGVACVAEGVSFIGIEKDPVSVRQIIEPGPPGIHAAPRGRCALAGTKRVRTRHKKTPPRVAPAPSPWPAQADPYGDQAMSYWVARSRIYAAIGSPEEAAKANELAPVGAQLGLL